jgi:hypothetical protein
MGLLLHTKIIIIILLYRNWYWIHTLMDDGIDKKFLLIFNFNAKI